MKKALMQTGKIILGFCLAAFPLSAFAQIEEIVVTAQKRAESLQDVPIAMQAVTQEQLDKLGIRTARDIVDIAPNMNISTQNPVSVAINIRGVGTNDFFSNSAGSVGIYMDEVTMSAPSLGNLGLFDMERVEVLRGPQNTLFGRNTTGGAVNYISRQPEIGGDADGYFAVNYGSHNLYEFEAASSFQLGTNSAIRVAAKSYDRDGLFNNLADDGAEMGQKDRKSFRITWVGENDTGTRVTANVHYGKEDSEITPYRFVGRRVERGSPRAFLGLPGGALAFNNATLAAATGGSDTDWTTDYGGFNAHGRSVDTTDWHDIWTVGPKPHQVKATGAYLKVEHDFDFAMFTSITSVDKSETSFQIDFGGPGAANCREAGFVTDIIPNYDHESAICVGDNPLGDDNDGFVMLNAQDHENDQWSQEFRLTSDEDGRFRWIAGIYYFHENAVLSQNMGFGLFGYDTGIPFVATMRPPFLQGQPLGGSIGLNLLSSSIVGFSNQAGFAIADLENDVISPYFRTEYDINDALTVTFGMRYTDDTKSANNIRMGNINTEDESLETFRSREWTEKLAAGLPDCEAANTANTVTMTNQGIPCISDVTRPDLEFSGVGGKFGLDYRVNEDVLVYGSYSRGFRSGKYDIEFFHGPSTGFGIQDLEEETLDAFEVGVKSVLMENTLELNAAAFTYRWNDQQLFDVNPTSGPTFLNVEELEMTGFEAEFKWAPGNGWFLQGGVGFLETEITDQGDDPDGGGPDDLVELGHELPNAPEFSYNLIAAKDFMLGDGRISIQADVHYRDGAKTAQTTRAFTDEYDDYTEYGLRIDYYFGDAEQYQLSLWGENLTSEEVCLYKLDLAAFSGTNYCWPNDGEALYGLQLRTRF